jgi:hypothetical protein
MSAVRVIFIPVPCAGQVYNRRSSRPVYPCEPPARWPLKQTIPIREERGVRQAIADARRLIADHRRSLENRAHRAARRAIAADTDSAFRIHSGTRPYP